MNSPLISVIVPVYRAEAFLKKCVDSILTQTFEDFELILVDDGSPDGCPAICDEYAKNNSKVKTLHQENLGVSTARNKGLEICRGKYFTFVDSDDYVSPTYLEGFVEGIRENPEVDFVVSGYTLDFGDRKEEYRPKNICKVALPEFKKNFKEFDSDLILRCVAFKLCKRELLGDLRFDPTVVTGEDFLFNINYFSLCKSLLFIPDTGYYYNQTNQHSAVHIYRDSYLESVKKYYLAGKIFESGSLAFKSDRFDRDFCMQGMGFVSRICFLDLPFKERKKKAVSLLNDETFATVLKGKYEDFTFRQRMLQTFYRHKFLFTLILLYRSFKKRLKKKE